MRGHGTSQLMMNFDCCRTYTSPYPSSADTSYGYVHVVYSIASQNPLSDYNMHVLQAMGLNKQNHSNFLAACFYYKYEMNHVSKYISLSTEAPKLDIDSRLRTQVAHVGGVAKIGVRFDGEIITTVTWYEDGILLKTKSHISIQPTSLRPSTINESREMMKESMRSLLRMNREQFERVFHLKSEVSTSHLTLGDINKLHFLCIFGELPVLL